MEKNIDALCVALKEPKSSTAKKYFEVLRTVSKFGSYDDLLNSSDTDLGSVSTLERLDQFVDGCLAILKNRRELEKIQKFIFQLSIPSDQYGLNLKAETLGSKLAVDYILFGNGNLDLIKAEFERLRDDYSYFYVHEHNKHHRQLVKLQEKIGQANDECKTLRKLARITQLKTFVNQELLYEFEKLQRFLTPCHPITFEDFLELDLPYCNCLFMPDQENSIELFLALEDRLETEFKGVINELSYLLSHKAIIHEHRDDFDKLRDALAVSDLRNLPNIISDELIDLIARVLNENSK